MTDPAANDNVTGRLPHEAWLREVVAGLGAFGLIVGFVVSMVVVTIHIAGALLP